MGGQLGSSSSSSSRCWYCIAAPQKYLSRRFAVSGGSAQARRCGGHPHSKPASKEIATSASKWWVLKRVFRDKKCEWAKTKINSSAWNFFGKKLPNKILKVHVKKIAKTKGQLKPAKFLTTKNCLSSWSKVTDAKLLSRTWTTKKKPNATRAEDSHAYVLHKLRARLAEATTLRDSCRSTGTETISSAYRKHGAVC